MVPEPHHHTAHTPHLLYCTTTTSLTRTASLVGWVQVQVFSPHALFHHLHLPRLPSLLPTYFPTTPARFKFHSDPLPPLPPLILVWAVGGVAGRQWNRHFIMRKAALSCPTHLSVDDDVSVHSLNDNLSKHACLLSDRIR